MVTPPLTVPVTGQDGPFRIGVMRENGTHEIAPPHIIEAMSLEFHNGHLSWNPPASREKTSINVGDFLIDAPDT
ncbi:hypothetical protein [Paraburkholderia megapolitana]|uniref:hypothetical protein n=1 Tax=Paraburkholderia megapolitana TaxID=420953 RepID=UPI0038BBE5AD